MVFNAIRFLCSLKASMATILINFQQKSALVQFSAFRLQISERKRFLARLNSGSKFYLKM